MKLLMLIKPCFITIFIILSSSVGKYFNPFPGLLVPAFSQLRDFVTEQLGNKEQHKILLEENKKMDKLQRQFPKYTPFFCNVNGPGRRSLLRPTSVHKLRPGDIDIVSTVGDSSSSGNGVLLLNITGLLVENKGITFTSGGDCTWREFLTLPNIIKEFNPNLYGYSLGNGPSHWENSRLNVAEGFARAQHMVLQIKLLHQRMKSDPNVDIQNHWKLLTIFIGNNDLCSRFCYIANQTKGIEDHKNDLIKVLRYIRDKIPRTFVNFIPLVNLEELFGIKGTPYSCELLNALECSCLYRLKFNFWERESYFDWMKKWVNAEYEIINREEFHTKEDFEVVIQPFVRNIKLPKLADGNNDLRYLAFDCFHFSQRGHAAAANFLWNNLLQPVDKKISAWSPEFTYFECPTPERPYIATLKNSRLKTHYVFNGFGK